MLFASSWVLPDTSGTGTACGPVENHTETVEPFATFLPPFGFCLVMVPFGWLDVESSRASSFKTKGLKLFFHTRLGNVRRVGEVRHGRQIRSVLMPVQREENTDDGQQNNDAADHGSDDDLLLLTLLRGLGTLFRTGLRSTPPFGFGTASNWPVTGLNACVGASVAGAMGTVAASISACLRAFMSVRSVNGFERGSHRHTAVHERQQIVLELGSGGVTVLPILGHRLRADRIPHLRQARHDRAWGSGAFDTCW